MRWFRSKFNQEIQVDKKTIIHPLACGLPLLMMPNREVAVVTVDAWVNTGAADEPAELSGISHFLEHMLFKGTSRYGLGEIEQKIESVGGVSNAGTSYDFTHYYVTMPAAAADVGIDMIAEMIRHSTLNEEELEKERLVILEEYRRKQDHPAGVMYERLYQELFESGPYHTPVIGEEGTIRSINRAQMLDYYHRRYGPATTALIVTGDFDPEQIVNSAEAAFAGFDRPVQTLRETPALQAGRGKRIHIDKPTGGEVYLAFALTAPGMNRVEDVLPLDMAQFILGQGRAAVLYQSIKEKQRLCSSISAFYPTHRFESLFGMMATCLPDQLGPLREGLQHEIARFIDKGPDEAMMNRARRLLASAHRFSMETTGGASSNIGYYHTLTHSVEFLETYLERIMQVSAADVQAVLAKLMQGHSFEEHWIEISVGPNGGS